MGLENRNHRPSSKVASIKTKKKHQKPLVNPIYWVVLTFVIIFTMLAKLPEVKKASFSIGSTDSLVKDWSFDDKIESVPNGIVITADRRGHYIGTGLINDQSMEFIIDTGATYVAVPKYLAQQVGLKTGREIVSHTAAGKVRAYQTTIPLLRIGSITLKNTRAVILNKLEKVLIGMTVLKKFKVTQFDGKMRIEVPQ